MVKYKLKRRGKGQKEKHQCESATSIGCTPCTGDWICNLGMNPDQELNQQPLGKQDDAQPTDPNRPELKKMLQVLVTSRSFPTVNIYFTMQHYFPATLFRLQKKKKNTQKKQQLCVNAYPLDYHISLRVQ